VSDLLTESDRRKIHEAAARFVTVCLKVAPSFALLEGQLLELLSSLDRQQLTDDERLTLARRTRWAIQDGRRLIEAYCEAALPLFAATEALTDTVEDDDGNVRAEAAE
jgi:hypothetical protein